MLDETKSRWCSKTPEYFQKIKKIAISLGASATAIWVVNDTMSLELPEFFMSICKYLITASAGMGVTAQLTRDSLNNEEPKV